MAFGNFCDGPGWDQASLNVTLPAALSSDPTADFQRSVLVGIPYAYLCLAVPVHIYNMKKCSQRQIKTSRLHNAKTICLALLLTLPIVSLIKSMFNNYVKGHHVPVFDIITHGVLSVTTLFVFALARLKLRKDDRSPGALFVFWLLAAMLCMIPVRYDVIQAVSPGNADPTSTVTHCLYYIPMAAMLILSFVSDNPSSPNANEAIDSNICPEASASLLSKITFSWFYGLILLGYEKPLEKEDLWSPIPCDTAASVYPKFKKEWAKEKCRAYTGQTSREDCDETKEQLISHARLSQKSENLRHDKDSCDGEPVIKDQELTADGPQSSLLRAVIRAFGGTFLLAIFFRFLEDLIIFVDPFLLKSLISFSTDDSTDPWQGYVCVALMFCRGMLHCILGHHHHHTCIKVGMRIRTATMSAVYRKTLTLTNDARKSSTVGEIVNVMAEDAQRLMDVCTYINMVWSSPLQLILSLYFLWQTLGPSVLAGLAVLLLMIPINGVIAKKTKGMEKQKMEHKDSRIKLMNEILNGIKILKLYAWEESFMKKILGIRDKELKIMKSTSNMYAVTHLLWHCAPAFVSLATFGVYVSISADNVLDAEKVFVSMSLFHILRFPLNSLPFVIRGLVETHVSLNRIQKFLKNKDLDPSNVVRSNKEGKAITVQRGVFSWGKKEEPTLKDIDLDIDEGSIVAVVGHVGAGKSSLISAFLGDMEKQEGQVSLKGSVAYVPQQAWIQNATLRENIAFGHQLDVEKYDDVVEACALGPDLRMLPGGNSTEIGEKGINLSGGQKQRVSLARAVYSNSDVYFLDDPLSAVDAHVGKHIFDNVLGPDGLLKNKTRILVTHGITFLPRVDKIIVMVGGRITETGSFQELLDRNGAFAEFLRSYSADAGESNEDDKTPSTGSVDKDGGQTKQKHKSAQSPMAVLVFSRIAGRDSETDAATFNKHSEEKEKSRSNKCDAEDEEKKKLIEEEKSETGRVSLSVILTYLKSMGVCLPFMLCCMHVVWKVVDVTSDFWLTRWSEEPSVNGTQDLSVRDKYLGVYGLLAMTDGTLQLITSFMIARATLKSSTFLHMKMLKNILRCPMSFFDVTPLGRVVNRFAKDIGTIDTRLSHICMGTWASVLATGTSALVVSINTPMFAVVVIPVAVAYVLLQRIFIATSRQLRRLESVARSPIFSHCSESVIGVSTIRAYGQQERFISDNERKIDDHQVMNYANICSHKWKALRLQLLGNGVVFFGALFAVMARDYLSGGIVALSITNAMGISHCLHWMVNEVSEMETNFISMERVKEYSEVPTEAEAIVPDNRPSENWPETGKVDFINYSTRYREGLDLVIKDINFSVQPGEKIGIVGRTGAGKSSLTLALFRIIEAAGGSIVIDGVDISMIGLQDLRSRLSIIPQDPVLFAGSLRMNLDPFDQYSNEEVWKALELSHLSDFVSGLADGLDYECSEGGENLSVGQRQLICLARALLRKSRILVLDEATAAVDLETDDLIQATIRTQFADRTIFTIAHRLNTIMDSTRVLVLDKGTVAEFDSPSNLLKSQGIFHSMATEAGLAT
ncbi:multidrug resistance-associated protein 1-like [Ptychodera flava]|uniref:multidrug resistance-associated protein 1-like n=1 Tax=Ptychodera flava TaxID=63121 RepID=UPI003969ECEF